eukprot:5624191-Pyramimonas_sp.AAC.1
MNRNGAIRLVGGKDNSEGSHWHTTERERLPWMYKDPLLSTTSLSPSVGFVDACLLVFLH